jgi:hypothetical protein
VQLLEAGQISKQAVAIRVVEEVPLHELNTVLDEVKPLNKHEPQEEAGKPDSTAMCWQGYSNTHGPNLRGPFFGAAECVVCETGHSRQVKVITAGATLPCRAAALRDAPPGRQASRP